MKVFEAREMNTERWRKIDQIYNEALGLSPDLRAGFVAKSCAGDEKLQREIEVLLAVDTSAPDVLLDQPVMQIAAETEVTSGSRLGPYEIGEMLGAGGMGKVFRALDTKLGRPVAIKMLNKRFSDRGQREARAIAALNHPNVCTIYEAGENYLAMELVEGETLASRLKKGPLRLNETIRYGAQIADALAAAHAKGLIHRDLKPANIMLTKSGVKVLDFGLAKFIDQPGETITQSGAVMGTPGYMAPEQREGRPCDQRTDIYALGLTLAEMAMGKRGETKLQPPAFAHVVDRCIAPDPDDRWQSARDVKAELEWATSSFPAEVPNANKSRRAILIAVGVTAVSVAAVLFGLKKILPSFDPPHVARLAIALPEQGLTSDPGNLAGPAAISPDGQTVVLQLGPGKRQELWTRTFASAQFQRLAGTEGARQPFWSPDGKMIGFFADGKLKKISVRGGPPEVLCDAEYEPSRGGAWSPNGTILFAENFVGLISVPERGGKPVKIASVDESVGENSIRFPAFLPDGNRFVYYSRTNDVTTHGIYLDALDTVGKKPRRRLVTADGPAAIGRDPFSKQDYLVFPNEKNVWTQAFDLSREQLNGEKVAIADDVGPFGLSQTGTLVFRRTSAATAALSWVGRDGRIVSSVGPPGDFWDLRISPDQKKVAVLHHRSSDGQFWIEIIDLARNVSAPFTDRKVQSAGPIWTHDGSRLYFASWVLKTNKEPSKLRLYSKAVDQSGEGDLISESSDRYLPHDLSPDGKQLAGDYEYGAGSGLKGSVLAFTPLKPIGWREQMARQHDYTLPQFSPDGRWVAYQAGISGHLEIYLTDFPEGRRNRQISIGGGSQPRWSEDGKELFYMGPDSSVWSAGKLAELSTGSERPVKLFSFPVPGPGDYFHYDVTRDGQRFLMVNGKPDSGSQELRVIFNWPELVRDTKRN